VFFNANDIILLPGVVVTFEDEHIVMIIIKYIIIIFDLCHIIIIYADDTP